LDPIAGLSYTNQGFAHHRLVRYDEAVLIVPWIGGVYAVRGIANAMLGRESASRINIGQASEKRWDRTLVVRAIRLERSKLAR